MLIDAHVHVWQAHPQFEPHDATLVSPHAAIPIELLDMYLDEQDVSRAVLVQPVYPGGDNSYVADCAAARPDRYAAVCVVDPRQPDAPDTLARWVRERGCRGIRLRPRIPAEGAVFGAPGTFPLWETIRDLKIVVSVLGGIEHLPALGTLARRYPSVPIVVDHLAHPDPAAGVSTRAALEELSGCDNVSLKVSGAYYYSRAPFPYADCHELVRVLLKRFGSHRLVWGSDFPHVLLKTTYARLLAFPERALPGLPAADRDRILGDNARRLYWGD